MRDKEGFSSIVILLITLLVIVPVIYLTQRYFSLNTIQRDPIENIDQNINYIDYSSDAKEFKYEEFNTITDGEITYPIPNKLTYVEDPTTFFDNPAYVEFKNNYIFSAINTCKFSFYFDEQNPVFFIAIDKGEYLSNKWICDTYSYLRFDEKTKLDQRLEKEEIIIGNSFGDGIYKYIRPMPFTTEIDYYTFQPDFKDQEEYKFTIVFYKPYEEYVKPVYRYILNGFKYNNNYKIPTKIEWEKVNSELLPIYFEYPSFWGEFKENIRDSSLQDSYTSESYKGTFTSFDSLYIGVKSALRQTLLSGNSITYAPPRGSVPSDFRGIPNKPEGIYVQLGTKLTNCSELNELSNLVNTSGIYIDFNIPSNKRIQGVRWQIPIASPYLNETVFDKVNKNCKLSQSNMLSDVKDELNSQLNDLLNVVDDETKSNIWILKRILDNVEITK